MMTMRSLLPLLLLSPVGHGCAAFAGNGPGTAAPLAALSRHGPSAAGESANEPAAADALASETPPPSQPSSMVAGNRSAAAAIAEPPSPTAPGPAALEDPRDAIIETPLDVPMFSAPLANGLFNPMPGGYVGGYRADTGLDIAGFHMPVYALAPGTLEYSEPGHTRWASDDNAIRLRLDQPIEVVQQLPGGRGTRTTRITHVWYAHLSQLRFLQRSGSRRARRVKGGELLGISGMANGSPHLHLGLLLNHVVDQRWGSYLLDDECRRVLGGWRRGQRLPRG